MTTQLIRLSDGTLVEVEMPSDISEPISGGSARRVDSTLENLAPLLIKTCQPIVSAWKEIKRSINIDSAEIELGLSFEAEGNLYIAKSKGGANLKVKLKLTYEE
jgi:hypothetical protein